LTEQHRREQQSYEIELQRLKGDLSAVPLTCTRQRLTSVVSTCQGNLDWRPREGRRGTLKQLLLSVVRLFMRSLLRWFHCQQTFVDFFVSAQLKGQIASLVENEDRLQHTISIMYADAQLHAFLFLGLLFAELTSVR